MPEKKSKLLLHICCVGCGAYIAAELGKEYDLTLFFYNPNIFPEEEYSRRLDEAKKISSKLNFRLLVMDYDHDEWLKMVKGLENEPEKGRRCELCINERLDRTAEYGSSHGYAAFATTLSISPHKLISTIDKAGENAMNKYGITYLFKDFKKKDGYKKSVCLSNELGLYRQDYCGCEFSIR